jgi:hypothetical protein
VSKRTDLKVKFVRCYCCTDLYILSQEAATTSDWGKMRFTQYPRKSWEEILPGLQPKERDLVSKLLVYESGGRLSAEEVCLQWFVLCLRVMLTGIRRCCNTAISRTEKSPKTAEKENIQYRTDRDIVFVHRILVTGAKTPPRSFDCCL